MDQAKISQHIAALLIAHDCVIVPAFGGFVANRAPARISRFNDRFDPPFRKISFNKLLTHNDGLLASYVAQKESEQYDQALKAIQACAIGFEKSLNKDKRLVLDGIGTLTKLSDGNIRFEQDREAAIALSEFGLESFFSHKIDRSQGPKAVIEPKANQKASLIAPVATVEPEQDEVREEPSTVIPIARATETGESEPGTDEIDQESKEKKRTLWPMAAAIALPIAAYATWLLMGADIMSADQRFHYSDLNPFTEKICPEYNSRLSTPNYELLPSDLSLLNASSEAEHIEIFKDNRDKTLVVSMKQPPVKPAASADLRYHIIGGCFSDMSNAESMVNKHLAAGSNASIVGQKRGLYRVSVASFATKKEAVDALASVRSEISNAWLLYK